MPYDDDAFGTDHAERLRQQHEEAPRANGRDRDPLNLIDPTLFEGQPAPQRRWLVPDWVPISRVTALYGAGGEGKTLAAQMLATACAIGKPWFGLPAMSCNSLLHYCEDDEDEMRLRQEDINVHYGCSYRDLGACRWLPRLGHDNALMTFEAGRAQHTDLFRDVLDASKDHEARLVITDTLADVFVGNENDRGQARAFAQQALGYLARELQGAVVALAHPSRAGMNSGSGESGSTAWIGTFRSQLYLSTPQPDGESGEPIDPNLRTLTKKKINAGRRGEEIELRWQNGVLVPTRPHAGGVLGWIERKTAKHVFLDMLDAVTAEGRYVCENQRAGNYAPKLFAGRPDRQGFRVLDFKRAMEELFFDRAITLVDHKDASRHLRQHIARAPT